MSIDRSSGSIYPSSSELNHQFFPTEGHMVAVPSTKTREGVVPIWSRAYADLTRCNHLIVNGQTIYSDSQINPPAGVEGAAHIFHRMEEILGSTEIAMRATSLMQQDIQAAVVLQAIINQKGLTKKEGDLPVSTHSLAFLQKRVTKLDVDQSKFTLIVEALTQQRVCELPEGPFTFFKVRITISGSIQDLKNKNGDKLFIKAAYTAEKPTEAEALRSNYSGTRAGLFDSGSYLS